MNTKLTTVEVKSTAEKEAELMSLIKRLYDLERAIDRTHEMITTRKILEDQLEGMTAEFSAVHDQAKKLFEEING